MNKIFISLFLTILKIDRLLKYPLIKGVAMIFRWGGPDFNSIYLYSLFNEFLCKLGFVWHEWAYEYQKKPNLHTNKLNTKLFCSTSPLKAPNRLKSLKLA
jgi:hypothetical protein